MPPWCAGKRPARPEHVRPAIGVSESQDERRRIVVTRHAEDDAIRGALTLDLHPSATTGPILAIGSLSTTASMLGIASEATAAFTSAVCRTSCRQGWASLSTSSSSRRRRASSGCSTMERPTQ